MAVSGSPASLTPGLAWAIPAVFLCLLLPARAAVAVDYGNGAVGAGTAVVLFALPLLYTLPRGRVLWDRYRWSLLAVQAVLTYLPFLMFGQTWVVGLSGLLGGLVLLMIRAPLSWLAFVGIIAVEGVLRIGVLGVYPTSGLASYSWVFVVPVDMALPLFGLVRLSDMVADLHAARTELAGLAVTQERVQSAARLHTAIGDRLEAVAALSRDARGSLPDNPSRARGRLAEAAGIARQAAEQVRQTIEDDPGRPWRSATQRAGETVAPRLALVVLVIVLGAFSVQHALLVADTSATVAHKAAAEAAIVAIAVLQFYHSLARGVGARTRAWRVTLPVQALLPFTGYAHLSLTGLSGFPAGSALLLLTGWRAWAAFAVIAPSMAVGWVLREPADIDYAAYVVGLSASTGLAVYGLSRLRDLAEELEATRRELARTAVERERLRVAQDIHDLLGLSLSAIALKCDLGQRLTGRDDARVYGELQAVVRLAAQARAEIRAVTGDQHGMSLRQELAAARDVLTTAGVRAEADNRAFRKPVPPQIDTVLATVLREAVTNVLRHSEATVCEIDLSVDRRTVRLRVANDGVTGEPPVSARERKPERAAGGHGLRNLAARAAAQGGQLAVTTKGERFEVTVQIPLPTGG
jgi:two-component system sensor histidine kinase DesK